LESWSRSTPTWRRWRRRTSERRARLPVVQFVEADISRLELDPPSMAAELREEVGAAIGTVAAPPMVGAWARCWVAACWPTERWRSRFCRG
jgi:hypothetical protein